MQVMATQSVSAFSVHRLDVLVDQSHLDVRRRQAREQGQNQRGGEHFAASPPALRPRRGNNEQLWLVTWHTRLTGSLPVGLWRQARRRVNASQGYGPGDIALSIHQLTLGLANPRCEPGPTVPGGYPAPEASRRPGVRGRPEAAARAASARVPGGVREAWACKPYRARAFGPGPLGALPVRLPLSLGQSTRW